MNDAESNVHTREYLTKLILMDVLSGIERHFGTEGLAQVIAHAQLANLARENTVTNLKCLQGHGSVSHSEAFGKPLGA